MSTLYWVLTLGHLFVSRAARRSQVRGIVPGDAAVRHRLAVDLIEPLLDDLAAEPPIEIDGARVGVEHPEIGAPFAAGGHALHRGAQQAATEPEAAPVGPDMEVVDVGAEARIAGGPYRDEA